MTTTTRSSWRGTVLGTQIAELLRRPGRFAATGLSLLLAAFVVFGTVMTQQILSSTAVERFRGTPGAVSAVLTSDAPGGIGDAELRRIGELPGVAEAVGRHDDGAPLGGSSVERYLRLYADPGTGPLSQVRLLRGTFPDGPDRIAVNEQAARDYGLAPGSPLVLLRVDPDDPGRTLPTEVEVSGVVRSAVTGQKQPAGYATELRIRRLLALPGHPRVDIRTESGTVPDGLREDIGRIVPSAELRDGAAVRAAEEKEAAASAGDLLELVSLFLAVAVVASALVAASTFRIVFAQRVRQLALLRAVGATGRQLRRALLAEGAAVGLAAGLAGVAAAWGCSHLVPPVSGRFGQPLSPAAGFPLAAAVLTVAGTALLAVLAVLAPSLSAARVSPMQALRAAEHTSGTRAASAGRILAGLLGAAGAAALAWHQRGLLPETEGEDIDRFSALLVITVSGTLALLALSALGPVLVRPVLAALSPPLRRLGTAGRLAVTSVGEAPRRAAAGMLVVALGASLISVTLVTLDSLRAYDRTRQAVEAPADYILRRDDGAPLPGLAAEVKALPELTGVRTFRSVDVVSGTRSATLTDLDPHRLGIASGLPTATGTLGAPRAGHAVVDAQYARDLGVRAGDRISVRYQERTTTFTVAATLRGSGPYHASVYVPAADLTRMGVDTAPTTITADAAEDGPGGRSRADAALTGLLADPADRHGRVLVHDPAEQQGSSSDLGTVGTTVILVLGLTVIVAVVGVSITASLGVVERTREFGLLRALGLTAGSAHRTVTVECAIHGALGGVLGLALALPYSWLVVRTIAATAPFSLPTGRLALVVCVLTLLTAAGGAAPAVRASRTPPVTAVAQGR
ncbi:ABC transporter permease [Streptomyces carminius]|uniref:ABC transporter permease n=1 Tax=Streptomyces carminius TaxID=2665496 RepID=A0A2M8LXE7_9ACTN|nr:FtsX-like permease family protein [Streptomyces carminius]PJE96594.1 ABC transporter permease [Streptomyces carminius]